MVRRKRKKHAGHPGSFKIDQELSLCFVPPMEEHGRGISLIQGFQLPFPPTEGLVLTGAAFNQFPSPEGFPLKDVTWDIDREIFLANISLISHGVPFTFIPDEIRSWIDQGWRFGSLEESYKVPESEDELPAEESMADGTDDEWDAEERLASMNPRSRPRHVTKVMRAMVREMAELYNNWPVAYAIDRTKRFFSEPELKVRDSKAKEKFEQAVREFKAMQDDDRYRWQKKVLRNHPPLDRIVTET